MSALPPTETDATTFGNLLRAWGDAGEAPPSAVVAAILHELAHESADALRPSSSVDVDAVWIDARGQVGAEQPATVRALAELMEVGLSGTHPGRTGDLMPPLARAGVERFLEWDGLHQDGCLAFAGWVREAFGPLAGADEVARCCRASAPLDPEAPTVLPTRSALSDPAPREAYSALSDPSPREAYSALPDPSPREAYSELPQPLEVPDDAPDSLEPAPVEPSPTPTEVTPTPPSGSSSSDELSIPPQAEADAERSAGDRPVVRRELPRRDATVSIVSAPAARRSARPLADRGDSILVPADRHHARGWFLLFLGIGLAVGLYFLVTG